MSLLRAGVQCNKCLKEPIGLRCAAIGKEEVPFGVSRVRISPGFSTILEKAADTRIFMHTFLVLVCTQP